MLRHVRVEENAPAHTRDAGAAVGRVAGGARRVIEAVPGTRVGVSDKLLAVVTGAGGDLRAVPPIHEDRRRQQRVVIAHPVGDFGRRTDVGA